MDVISVTDLRSDLREVIDQVRAGQPIAVGAHRKPEAVLVDITTYRQLVGPSIAIPERVLHSVLVDVATATAHRMLTGPNREIVSGRHPGDRLGRILSWLWDVGRTSEALQLVVDLLAELRYHHPSAPEPGERITLQQLLWGIDQAYPGPGPAPDALRHALEAWVPGYFTTDDVNAP